jgi:hypothetical protein
MAISLFNNDNINDKGPFEDLLCGYTSSVRDVIKDAVNMAIQDKISFVCRFGNSSWSKDQIDAEFSHDKIQEIVKSYLHNMQLKLFEELNNTKTTVNVKSWSLGYFPTKGTRIIDIDGQFTVYPVP